MTEKERVEANTRGCIDMVHAMVSGLHGGNITALIDVSHKAGVHLVYKMRGAGIKIRTERTGYQNIYFLETPLNDAIEIIRGIFGRRDICEVCGGLAGRATIINNKHLCAECAKKHFMQYGAICERCGEVKPYAAFPKRKTRTGIVRTCTQCLCTIPPTGGETEGFGFHTWAILTDDCRRVYTDIDEGKYKNGQAKAEMTSGISFEEEV